MRVAARYGNREAGLRRTGVMLGVIAMLLLAAAAPLRAQTDVQMTKAGPASVNANQSYSYTVTVTNAGLSGAATVIVRDSLPAAGTFVSAAPAGTRVGRLITWPTIASLAPGASQVYTVTWTAPANPAVPLTLRNMAYSTSTTADPVPSNNSNTNPAAIVNTVVVATADVATTKTGPATVNALANYAYTLTARNNGPSSATGVVLADTLPATVTFVSATNGGTRVGNVVTWPAATLASAATVARSVTVRAPASGTLLNIAASSATTLDPNPADNNGSAAGARVTTVVNSADVATTTTGPATVNGGANYAYTLTVRNNGTGTATGIVVTDTLPATVTFVSATNGGVLGAGNVVTWPVIATLANAATTTRSVTVTAPPSGTLLNIAASTSTSTDPVPANNNGSAAGARVTTVVNSANVVTTKTGPATANAGANITYTLTVRNAGPGAATGIVLVDTLPAAVTFVSASAGGTLGAGNVVTWPVIATLANAATTTRTVTVTTPATGTLVNIAASTSTSVDPTPANNNGSAAAARVTTVILVADVATTKTGPATASGGATYNYTITVRNNGPTAAPSIVVTDTLPATVTFVSASNGGTLGAGNVVTWPTIATLANGATTTRTVTVRAPAAGSLLNITASRSGTTDPVPANNNGSLPAARVTTVVTAADLVTTKTGPATVNPGGSITYTITTRNLGPNAAPTVVIRDTLPATVTFVSASNAGVLGAGNVVTWPAIASLANGASTARTVTVTAPALGTLLNIAASSSATTDPNPNNSNGSLPAARVTTTVNPTDVVTTKTGPATATLGSNITYAIAVRNAGPVNAIGVVVTDTLPTGLTFVSATGGGTASGSVVTWPTIATMANGATQNFSVTVSVPVGGTFTNIVASTASSSDLNPGNNNGSLPAARVTTVVLDQADVATTKTGPATANAGQNLTYALTVSNAGPSTAASVVVTDTLPAGVTFVSATGGGTVSGSVVTWPAIAALGNGASQAYSVTVTAPASGMLLNIMASSAVTADPNPGNNNGSAPAARVTTTVVEQADVATTKTGPATVNASQNFSYTIAVVNTGPSAAATVVVTDTLPAGVTFVSATGGGTVSGNVITWPSIASLASGTSQGYGVTVTAPASGTLTNILASTSPTADPNPGNNDGSAPASRVITTIIEMANVVTTKTGPATAIAATNFSYAITIQNAGPSVAANVVVTDTLPAGITFVSATGGGTLSGSVITWPSIATLANGASQGYGVTVTAPATGTLLNIVASTASTADPVPSDNDGSAPASRVTTTVSALADVASSKTGPARVNANDLVNYTITVTNLGPSAATGVLVSDPVPAGATFVSASNGGVVNGGAVQWPVISSLAAGQALTYTLQVRAPLLGTLTNVVSSTATAADPVPGNNDGSAPAARVLTTIEPVDLAVTKASLPEFRIGTIGTYTLTVRNVGNAPSVGPITVVDTLPASLRYSSADGPGWSCGASGSIVTCATAGTLAPGGSTAILLNVDVLPAAAPSVTNSVAVDTPGDTSSGGNNASSVATAVRAQSPLVAQKTTGSTTAEIGDVVDYILTVENQSAQPVPAVVFNDQLPLGFAYQPGTTRLNGIAAPDPAGAPGPALGFPIGTVAGNATATVTYRVYLGPGAPAGDGLNRAQALSTISGVASNMATAKVEVTGGVFSDRGIVAGKIFIDCACDPDRVQGSREIGIPGVRIMLEDGTSTVTDVEGKFNFYGLAPRVHVLKVDVTTLPPGSKLAAVSSRNAGDGWTRFVDLRNSEFARGDFVEVSHDPAVLAAVIARRNRGEVTAAIRDSSPMVMAGDSLAPSGETVPSTAYQSLLGGLSTPVSAEGAASPVLRLPQSEQPERLARPTDSRLEMMVPAQGIPADGQTSVPVRVKVVASDGSVITTPTRVTLETTLGRWLVEDLDATEPGVQAQMRDGQGEFMLAASPREGVGEIRATSGALVQTGRVAFLPVERPLTAVGIVEGRIDLRSLTSGSLVPATPQDGFEQELKDISISGDSGLDRAAARAALYLRGKVKGSYLLTLAFDTERDPGKRYMQDIQPDEFYPVYGDASVKDYGAQSYDRLYVRIDKDRNHFLYGDYQTPSPSQARQLGGYLRSLTGAVQHFENKTVQANAFAAHTRITQVVDELRGMGISGPYQLSQASARINSERIDILTRDRNQPERLLKIVPLQRFTDYTVEPFTGRILLRQPLPSLDAQLNPVSMRVTYEVEPQDAPQSWVYGADAQVRISSFAEVGGAIIQDDNPYNGRQIYTLNGSARLGKNTQVVAEGALTSTDSLGEGGAGRFELRHQSGKFSGNVFGAMSATTFSNPSATFGVGQMQFGARAAMQLDSKSGVRGEALFSEDRVNGGRRKGALLAYERAITRLFRAEIGYRWAEETTAPVDTATAITPGATPNETNAIGVKVTGLLPDRRGSASVEFEQDVVNTDQRRAALAAEYWVFPRLRLYGRYEMLSSFAGPYALNGAQRLAQAVVGFDLAYFRDGQFFSEYRARDAFSGREAEATIGLRNRWQVAPGIRLDASFERVNPIRGGAGVEATAVTGAIEYTRSPLWKGTLRAEYRNAASGDNFLATLGYARKLTRDWTFLGRGFWNALPNDQLRTRGQLGLAWRQTDQNHWNGLARVEHGVERLRNGLNGELTSRQLDIAVAQINYQPILKLTLSAQYAAKWLRQEDAFLSKTATQLGQLRGIYDLDRNWDVGLQGSMMWGGSFDSRHYGVGGELGRRIINNLRVAAGYNLFGFRDSDLRETDYTLQGAYFRLDFKFDESILSGLKKTGEAP